jgi:hypothetical protein
VTTTDIAYDVGGSTMIGRLALPEGDGTRPAVLIAHEGNGLDDYQKQRADRFAELGYVAFALDYHGGGRPLEDRADINARLTLLSDNPELAREMEDEPLRRSEAQLHPPSSRPRGSCRSRVPPAIRRTIVASDARPARRGLQLISARQPRKYAHRRRLFGRLGEYRRLGASDRFRQPEVFGQADVSGHWARRSSSSLSRARSLRARAVKSSSARTRRIDTRALDPRTWLGLVGEPIGQPYRRGGAAGGAS